MSESRVPLASDASRLSDILQQRSAERAFLVTGRASFALSGAEQILAPILADKHVVRFNDFSPNPTAEDVARGVALFRAAACDIVIAVGGGSALDIAKVINLCGSHDGDSTDYLVKRRVFTTGGLPMVAIPTTSGTGAEVTQFATIYVDGKKYSAAHPMMRPDHALLIPSLTRSLTPSLTASTGIDALAQGIESLWSVNATEVSRDYARQAIELAFTNLPGAVNHPSDVHREHMMTAAHLAGEAINISRTTAPHALSYAMTIGFGVSHGHAVGLTLGAICEHNSEVVNGDVIDDRGTSYVRARLSQVCQLLGCTDGAQARGQLTSLMQQLGLETRLRELGMTRADLPTIAGSVNDERLANNPRRLSRQDVGRILESIY